MASGYDTPNVMFKLISQLNNLRFEGNVCECCEDSTVYQVADVMSIESISTTSTGASVRSNINGGGSCEVVLRCCGCGEDINLLEAGIRG